MTTRYYYLEQKRSGKVIRRVPTSVENEPKDRLKMEYLKGCLDTVSFVVSSEREKIIN